MNTPVTRDDTHATRRLSQARAATARPSGDRRAGKGSRSQQRARAATLAR